MNILALETSGKYCSAALLTPRGEIIELIDETTLSHSERLLVMVDTIMRQAKLEPDQLSCIAVTRGPGSFTGLRIGIAVAQGLAFGYGVPVIPVSSLAIVAAVASDWLQQSGIRVSGDARQSAAMTGNGSTPVTHVLAMLDARMNEIYCGHYDISSGTPKLIGDESVLAPTAMTAGDGLQAGRYLLAGSGLVYAGEMPGDLVNGCFSRSTATVDATALEALMPVAGKLAQLAQIKYGQQQWEEPGQLAPTYLRNKVTG